jgi:hypothetical protein
MKKILVLCLSLFLLLASAAVPAFSWGSATHAYIAGKIGKIFPLMNANEVYGIMGPDLFNYSFDPVINSMNPILRAYTHGDNGPMGDGFLQVWYKASWWGYQKSAAFGYVAHNDVWGADFTAHHEARLGALQGYIIKKAERLNEILDAELTGIGLPDVTTPDLDFHALRIEVCHNLVETAGDILIKRSDFLIGQKILTASILRTPDFPKLLVQAMLPAVPVGDKEMYKTAIIENEKSFRQMMVSYGGILTLPEEQIIQAFTDQMTALGIQYLYAMTGGYVNLIGQENVVRPIAEKGIVESLKICQNDYLPEINYTINFVKKQLNIHGVKY